jgi:hypothetical protein
MALAVWSAYAADMALALDGAPKPPAPTAKKLETA